MNTPTFMYHRNNPEGKIFDADLDEEMQKLMDEGWVDTPAKLDPNYVPPKASPEEMSALERANQEIAQLRALMAERAGASAAQPEKVTEADKTVGQDTPARSLLQRFNDGDDMTKTEMVGLARHLGIPATDRWNPGTIGKKIRAKT